jgi:hypothetical protein
LSLFQFVITYHLEYQQGKFDVMSHRSYLTPKEGNATYKQQFDIIFKLEHLRLQALLIISYDITFLCQIHEDLKKDSLTIGIQGQLRNCPQIQDFSNDHATKFKFQDGLFYHDGFLYVPNAFT